MKSMTVMAHRLVKKNMERQRLRSDIRSVNRSKMFNAPWYLARNPDVADAKVDPLIHFLLHGAAEGRDPSESFSTKFYLDQNADVRASGINPLVHFVLHGAAEGRRPYADAREGFPCYPNEMLSVNGLTAVAEYMARVSTPADVLARPDSLAYSPLISIILPVWNTPPHFLYEALQSIFSQTYTKWEICLVDDCSTEPATLAVLDTLKSNDKIKHIRTPVNSGIAVASQAALIKAAGEYIAFVDHDDLLVPTALSEVVALLRDDLSIDFIYSDHAQADERGLPRSVSRKPEWSPEFLLSTNYIVHFKVVRKSLLLSIGGLADERSFVQDLGMSLRLTRGGAKIKHLPRVAYYWRAHAGSVAATTESKQGIEQLIVDEYNKHSKELNYGTHTYWPKRFQSRRIGIFEMAFPDEQPSTAIVAIVPRAMALDADAIREHMRPQTQSGASLHLVSLEPIDDAGVTPLTSDAALKTFFKKLPAQYIVLVNAASRCISAAGFSALTGYLRLDDSIGAVGAKILDGSLRIKAGGLLLRNSGSYGLISGGRYDDDAGHWYINQATSNVDAVSQRCMAVRRRDLIGNAGLMLHKWDELAGIAFSQELIEKGCRIVYNTSVKLYDPAPVRIDPFRLADIHERTEKLIASRIYKEMID